MKPRATLLVGAAILLLGTVTPIYAGDEDADTWWRSPAVRSRIGLTAQQVSQLDVIYRDSLPARRRLRQQLDAERRRLARVLDAGVIDDAGATAVVTRVFDAERRRNIARTLLLFRMYRVLSAEQRAALADIGLLYK